MEIKLLKINLFIIHEIVKQFDLPNTEKLTGYSYTEGGALSGAVP